MVRRDPDLDGGEGRPGLRGAPRAAAEVVVVGTGPASVPRLDHMGARPASSAAEIAVAGRVHQTRPAQT
ncbi:hypothetical protein [Streptomyces sp. NPDC006368]|uniref:hypothetical protein n=1 Tax=Streptomyces sp. NPDC006368 TaxID=3156760 RepID=UPI0033AE85F3